MDHINGHGGDCRRSNMRICTRNQNMRNRAKCRRPCTSPYKGVTRNEKTGKCRVRIGYKGEKLYLGTFDSEIEAARAYDWAAVMFHGPYARLNLPEEWPPDRRAAVHAQHQAPPARESKRKKARRSKGRKGGRRRSSP